MWYTHEDTHTSFFKPEEFIRSILIWNIMCLRCYYRIIRMLECVKVYLTTNNKKLFFTPTECQYTPTEGQLETEVKSLRSIYSYMLIKFRFKGFFLCFPKNNFRTKWQWSMWQKVKIWILLLSSIFLCMLKQKV